jgi:hypothetical protein
MSVKNLSSIKNDSFISKEVILSSVKNHQAVIPPDDSLLMKQTVAEF